MIKDLFLTKLFGYDCYADDVLNFNQLKKIQKPFFLTIKSKNKIDLKKNKNFKISLKSKQINFKKKVLKKEEPLLNCRKAKLSDKKKILKIALNSPSISRFLIDKTISKNFKKNYKKEWILNYFRKKRGDNLLVAFLNNTIYGNHLKLNKRFTFDTYVKRLIKKDMYYVFKFVLENNMKRWRKMKKIRYKNFNYKSKLLFYSFYSIESKSNKCLQKIKDYI